MSKVKHQMFWHQYGQQALQFDWCMKYNLTSLDIFTQLQLSPHSMECPCDLQTTTMHWSNLKYLFCIHNEIASQHICHASLLNIHARLWVVQPHGKVATFSTKQTMPTFVAVHYQHPLNGLAYRGIWIFSSMEAPPFRPPCDTASMPEYWDANILTEMKNCHGGTL